MKNLKLIDDIENEIKNCHKCGSPPSRFYWDKELSVYIYLMKGSGCKCFSKDFHVEH